MKKDATVTHNNKITTINYLHIDSKFITYKKLQAYYHQAVLSQYNH